MTIIHVYYCSFCHKHQSKVDTMIAGPDRINICDECVRLSYKIVEERSGDNQPVEPTKDSPSQNDS